MRLSDARAAMPLGALGAALCAAAAVFARAGIPAWIPPSPLRLAGIPSPLSGMTRSFVALAGGDVVASFAWHPLGPPAFVACAVAVAVAVLAARGVRAPFVVPRPARRIALVAVLGGFAAAWALKIAGALPA